ncbi:hypothetical protein HNP82_001546 [Catenibacillus scindens]|uniref:Endonuclease GajA/Old nuclease/RecF-like AAA domain-containing protein n=1 Tax=Catenibacillus scindens TaxID=673271 RepID=A0A7W8H9K4_9FIRM|nr:AAA family ATPase [Catenibacillus scindens]MBB5264419.1 hypothetical protein [Catenibacillus scindens]
MKIGRLEIHNFKSIRHMTLENIENALILVGKNNTGKTVVLDAVRLLGGQYPLSVQDFSQPEQNIVIRAKIIFEVQDYEELHSRGVICRYKSFEAWKRVFMARFPSLCGDCLEFSLIAGSGGRIRYDDGHKKNNTDIPKILPKIYFIDSLRHLDEIEDDLILFQDDETLQRLKDQQCIFNSRHQCRHCFQCIGLIQQKKAGDLNVMEAMRLTEYKLYSSNLSRFAQKVNEYFAKNGGFADRIEYRAGIESSELLKIQGIAVNKERESRVPVTKLGEGMRSIYILSLLEAYIDEKSRNACIILMEDPEIFLHPQLQKSAAEILYRLSKKNQVFFSTHSPNMIFNFTSRQIRQILLDKDCYSVACIPKDIDVILDDLGYTATDLMNVSFVFIVEGRQDKSRLPLLLKKYYSEIYNEDGTFSRVAIITTNSCTNIKTYANLKYINKLYLKDQFLMIRDGDGKDPKVLARQLCKYYEERNLEDVDRLPRVTPKNVLILKYYSFENYFLNPKIMVRLGIVESEEAFWETLFDKWTEYLHRLTSGKHLVQILGKNIDSIKDLQENYESFKIYMRGHNLFDIFYGRFKDKEQELLEKYIELAGREEFADILDAIDRFVYFDSRKKRGEHI